VELPAELVQELNELGFAVISADEGSTFTRMAISGELFLTVDPLGEDAWRVSVKRRQPDQWGDVPNPMVPISLARLGKSSDGDTLDLSTGELVDALPRLLRECVLPMIDLAPS
jgi:hypothetical protein